MRTASIASALIVVLGSTLGACGDEASPEPVASASGRAGSVAKPLDQDGYCYKVCQRATSCGLESAESLARGTPGEVALIAKLKAESTSTELECVTECRKETLAELDRSSLAAAERCVDQTTCDLFSRCLEGSPSADHP